MGLGSTHGESTGSFALLDRDATLPSSKASGTAGATLKPTIRTGNYSIHFAVAAAAAENFSG